MKLLLIYNDPPYGTERFYNALRLLNALMKKKRRPTSLCSLWPTL